MLYLMPGSGHTIHAGHIERPEKTFHVRFSSPRLETAEPGVMWESQRRWCKVLAETAEGAIRIAKYHYFMSSKFELLQGMPNVK